MPLLYPALALVGLHTSCSEPSRAPTLVQPEESSLAPLSSTVGRLALLVRSSLALGESDTTLQEILADLHKAQMEAFAVSVEAVLGAYKLATPAERLARQQELEQALIDPLLTQRSALLIDPVLEDIRRVAGIPQIAHRLLQHHSNEALASSLNLDLNLEQLRSEFAQAPQLATRGELQTLEQSLIAFARELYTFQARRLQALPRILEHLDERRRLELVLGPAVSGWLGVQAGDKGQP